ncbi:hypothetical protein [Bacteroides sp. AF39-11AC]|uniref:hypothetical protein n=1 Tax=Bacteroides TaxID=816 RepID=UPI00351799E9
MFTRPTPFTHSTNSSHSLDRFRSFTFKTAPSGQQVYTFKALRNKHYGNTRTTANNHLQRLQKEGKLTNVERRAQPIYRPMPGYYGMSRDAELKR